MNPTHPNWPHHASETHQAKGPSLLSRYPLAVGGTLTVVVVLAIFAFALYVAAMMRDDD